MATSFSANQYENAFKSNKLSNWEVPSKYKECPNAQQGYTKIIANDRGHIEKGVPRSSSNPWGNFVGTWDIPKKIPGNSAKVKTARTTYAQEKLQRECDEAEKVLSGSKKNNNRGMVPECSPCISKPAQKKTTKDSPPTDARGSGAEAPGSKMFPYSYSPAPCETRRSATPPRPLACQSGHRTTSPIPGVPDIPDVLAMDTHRQVTSPQEKHIDGLSAL